MNRIQGAKQHLSFKIISLAETNLSELISFGSFSFMAMAQEIFKETELPTGIHGSSVQILHTHKPDKTQISDLDMIIMAMSSENTARLLEIAQTHTNTRAFTLKNETGTAFGFQLKGAQLGGISLNFSLTIYTTPPTDPIYDDIAHSEILWLTPRYHLTSKFPDIPFVHYLKKQRLLLTPPNTPPKKQIFRIAMREAKGWKIHTSEMDKRVYESGASYWADPYRMGTGINATWIDHFGQEDQDAYPRIVFFMLSRHLRHSQDTKRNLSLWQCLATTLDRTTSPQKVTNMTELANYLHDKNPDGVNFHSYLSKFKNYQEECLSLCAADDACTTEAARDIIRAELTTTLTTIANNALKRHVTGLIPADESAWKATLRHIGYNDGHPSQIPDPLFRRIILPALTHVTDSEAEQFIHDQLSTQCASTAQYTSYATNSPSALESWLRKTCDATANLPDKTIIDTACKLIDLGVSLSDTTAEKVLQHMSAHALLSPKPEGYYTLWEHLVKTASLTKDIQKTIQTILTPVKNWGYPDEALLPPIIDRLTNTPPTHRYWPTRLEILCLARIRPTPHPKLDAYTKSLFSTPDWHQGFTLHESLSHIQDGFTHKPKLREKFTEQLLDAKDPASTQDAESALCHWTKKTTCPNSSAWLKSVDYLIARNSPLQPDVLEHLWTMSTTETWHSGFSQKAQILSAVIAHQVRKDPSSILQIPDLHHRFENLILDEDTQVHILDHATDATLVQCLDIYIWNTNPLSTTLCDYRREFITDTKRHTPIVQIALREQAQKQQSTDIALSLSIWINLPDSDDARLSSIELNPGLSSTNIELYSAAISQILKSNSPDIKARFQTILDRLDFDKIDSKLHAQLITEMTERQRHLFLEHNPKRISVLSTNKQKELLETVVYEDHPMLTSTLIEVLSQAHVLSVIGNSIRDTDHGSKALRLIEIALIQKKIKRSELNKVFERQPPVMQVPDAAKHPHVYRAWTQYQKDKATQLSLKKQEEDASAYRKLRLSAENTIKKATSDHLKNKTIDTSELEGLKTLFLDSSPAHQKQLLKDCADLKALPFYLQDIPLLDTMRTRVETDMISTPPTEVALAIKADNLHFMQHLHTHGLSLCFRGMDYATNSPRTLLDFAVTYQRPAYYRYLFKARRTELQNKEQEAGTLICTAICGKLETLKFLLTYSTYDKSPAACEKRIQQIFTLFSQLATPNFQWNPSEMLPKSEIIEGLRRLIEANYLHINTPISMTPETQPQHPITIALGVETFNTVDITTNGLSDLLIQAGGSRPSNAQLGALFLAYAIHQKNRDYSIDLDSKIRDHITQGFRLAPDDFKGLFKLFPDFVSTTYLRPLLNVILTYQKETIATHQNDYNPFSALILASPVDHAPTQALIDAGLSPNERANNFHLSHLVLRYATADMFAFLVEKGMSLSEEVSATDLFPTFPPLSLTTREYLYFVTPPQEKLGDFHRKNNILNDKGITLSAEKIMILRVFETTQKSYMTRR